MPDYHNLVKEFLSLCVEAQASDLHLSIGHPPILRITGRLVPLLKEKKLTSQGISLCLNDRKPKREVSKGKRN